MATNPLKKSYTLTQKDFYKNYKKKVKSPVTWKQYAGILKDFFVESLRRVIYDRDNFKMPFNLGYMTLTSRKIPIKHTPIDRPHYLKTGEIRRNYRFNTDNRFYSVKWRRVNTRLQYSSLYTFKIPRSQWAFESGITAKSIDDYVETTLKNKQKLLP